MENSSTVKQIIQNKQDIAYITIGALLVLLLLLLTVLPSSYFMTENKITGTISSEQVNYEDVEAANTIYVSDSEFLTSGAPLAN